MVELFISLVRNAACVLKSLLPVEYAVMQPLMSFPFPAFLLLGASASQQQQQQQQQLEMFTCLEGLIGLLQLAGAGFNLCKGAKVKSTQSRDFTTLLLCLRTLPDSRLHRLKQYVVVTCCSGLVFAGCTISPMLSWMEFVFVVLSVVEVERFLPSSSGYAQIAWAQIRHVLTAPQQASSATTL